MRRQIRERIANARPVNPRKYSRERYECGHTRWKPDVDNCPDCKRRYIANRSNKRMERMSRTADRQRVTK